MYNLTIIKISDSKKSAFVTVTKDLGIVISTVAAGWMKVGDKTKVGDILVLPAETKVYTKDSIVINKETGESTTFANVVID